MHGSCINYTPLHNKWCPGGVREYAGPKGWSFKCGGGGGRLEGIIKLMLQEGEWNNIGPGGLNTIGACPGAFASLFQGGGGDII